MGGTAGVPYRTPARRRSGWPPLACPGENKPEASSRGRVGAPAPHICAEHAVRLDWPQRSNETIPPAPHNCAHNCGHCGAEAFVHRRVALYFSHFKKGIVANAKDDLFLPERNQLYTSNPSTSKQLYRQHQHNQLVIKAGMGGGSVGRAMLC